MYAVYVVYNACWSNPCNHGTCVTTGGDAYTCECDSHIAMGDACESKKHTKMLSLDLTSVVVQH